MQASQVQGICEVISSPVKKHQHLTCQVTKLNLQNWWWNNIWKPQAVQGDLELESEF